MDTIEFLRNKNLLAEDAEKFKIIYDDGTEVLFNDLLDEYS